MKLAVPSFLRQTSSEAAGLLAPAAASSDERLWRLFKQSPEVARQLAADKEAVLVRRRALVTQIEAAQAKAQA